jgi:hypothetical protein
MVMTKRKIFAELMEGIAAIQAHRVGKSALRSYKIKPIRLPRANARTTRKPRSGWFFSVFGRKLNIKMRQQFFTFV